MAELLPDQQYIGEWPDDTAELVLLGTTPGPAGSYELQLDTITVAIDAADPSIVNWITGVEPAGERGAFNWSLLERLIGAEPTRSTIALLRTDDRVRFGPPLTTGPQRGAGWETERQATMMNIIIGMSLAADAGLLPYERALGRLEAFQRMSELWLPRDLDDWPDRVHEAAVDLLDLPPNRIDPDVRDLVATVFEQTASLLDDQLLAARLRRMAIALGPAELFVASEQAMDFEKSVRGAGAAAPARAAMAPSPMPVPAQQPVEVALHSLSYLAALKVPSINRTSGDEYEVRLTDWAGRADGWWVRGFRGNDAVPLAVVPMSIDGDDAVARFLVAPSQAASLVVDIVDDPSHARPSAQVAAFRAAIASGKRAAQLERLEQRPQAHDAWQRCSELHTVAGDESRASAAAAKAAGADRTRRRAVRGSSTTAVINDWIGPVTPETA
ncbi:MAG: hypothetical protein ABIR32_16155 [Ilumatobacteraceae bacterium]